MAMINFVEKVVAPDDYNVTCKVLIVDDEQEVHIITKAVLNKFVFEGKKLEILSAFSGAQALEILSQHDDIQLVLLDVVMETDDAGLIVAKKIREELGQKKVRIVLRTGQPGSAPEKEVIDHYDINDYKEKTELTSDKLYTTVISSLRAYRDLERLYKNRRALEQIIEASKTIFKLKSFYQFVEGTLNQVSVILNIGCGHIFETESNNGFFATLNGEEFKLIASIGSYKGKKDSKIFTNETLAFLNKAYQDKKSFFEEDTYVAFFEAPTGKILFLYLKGISGLNDEDKKFLEVFSSNIAIAFNNTCINQDVHKNYKQCVQDFAKILTQKDIFEDFLTKEELLKIYKDEGLNEDMIVFLLDQFDKLELSYLNE